MKDGSIEQLFPKEDKPVGEAGIIEKYGVPPSQMTEYLMLLGDKVDNIPGVEKCGPMTAAKWLVKYGSIKGIKKHRHDLTPVLYKNFKAAYKNFKLTRQLIQLKLDVDIDPTWDKLKMGNHDTSAVRKMCSRLAFEKTLEQIEAFLGRQETLWTK